MALITVLLLVAVMGTITAATLEVMNRSVAMANNGRSAMQARHHVRAMEHVARTRLSALREAYPDRLTRAGGWADQPVIVPTESGSIILKLSDGSHCFNVNAVALSAQGGTITINQHGLEHLVALSRLVGIAEPEARSFVFSLVDFIDSDFRPSGLGGEDEAYANLAMPYRVANALLADASELAAVEGLEPEQLASLMPYLCALPSTDMVKINVNTLQPDQAPLLAMLAPGQLTIQQARRAIAARPELGWSGADDFWNQPALSGIQRSDSALRSVDVKSDLFKVDMVVDDAGFQSEASALIALAGDKPKIVSRTWGASY